VAGTGVGVAVMTGVAVGGTGVGVGVAIGSTVGDGVGETSMLPVQPDTVTASANTISVVIARVAFMALM